MNSQAKLLDKLCANIAPGKLEWIGLRSERRAEVVVVEQAEAVVDLGLVGDHRMKKTPGSARQISGMNMNLLRYQRLQIGDVILETNALCHPCSRMDEALGKGGTAAMFGYGGLCAKVIQGGFFGVGDAVMRLALLEND
jgi:MOSC domain-containing protein YiiM